MRRNLQDSGISAVVDAQYVESDAWDWISSDDEPMYDVVIASKCLGLIYSADPSERDTMSLLDYCSQLLRDDGSVFIDHHLAYSRLEHGHRIVDATPPALLPLATIAGRYADDVSYTAEVQHPDFDQVANFVSSYVSHEIQVWQFFHYRLKNVGRVKLGEPISVHKVPTPVEFPAPPKLDYDPLADSMFPVNAKGVKRVPTPADIKGHPYKTALVKYDGSPGVVILDGPYAIFISGLYRFTRTLSFSVSPRTVLSGELVFPTASTSVVVLTGLISLGDAHADPLDYSALSPLVPILERLSVSGLVPTVPEHVRYLKGDRVTLPTGRGGAMRLPVDGVQLNTSGKSGVFVKPVHFCTVDATPSDAASAIADAYASLGVVEPPEVEKVDGDGVYEFYRVSGTGLWRVARRREDKHLSDKPGAVVQTVAASIVSEHLNLKDDVETVAHRLFR
ncbi:methyltransferase [Aspergillus spelaeus tetramycovirus 1]|uniref:Methyltransferase n=1 Tax=Aspergillus spelaeus tetramycovirus 1 TaxID=2485922 RepID=A0A3G3C4N5_9VIRU|nr:methyltransferase [Aspergillus spelaeus tetramycovirus 1]AYP71807.1 methyltransferase [Aspergillus spelaeus tetramycovirus 1]